MGKAWANVNHTELYQACRQAGLNVHPAETTEDLRLYVTGEKEPPNTPHPIDDWRDAIMRFILDYWKKVHVQLKCPASSGDPKACYGCVDTQVITCLVQSSSIEGEVDARRTKR